jgi:hypothetical protein
MSEDIARLIASLNETDIDIEELMKKYLDSELKTLELLELKEPKDSGSPESK